ncbi:MAG: hydroxymethylbilane synthase [Rhizobiales bacterium]|nr:hydroxymethylbilane synthase [Hyphomicrobiales bacterium]MBN9013213.1 hydroxymethylbilane synthase [Hyphomicrobiales bacterium]
MCVALRGHRVQSSGEQSRTEGDILATIGTRGSPLALAQAHDVRARLARTHGVDAERIAIRVIRTTGDAIQDRTLADSGGKGLFTKEIEEALLAGSIDLAVHSSKDVPTFLPDATWLSAFLPREDPRDVFISHKAASLADLPAGAVVGTASLRRQAMVLRLRPDLKVEVMRGNVETRLRKLASGEADATLLALAGLKRLGLEDKATRVFSIDEFLPAVGQGAIAIESRRDDDRTNALVKAIADADTDVALSAERSFLALLDGSCRTPIGGHCRVDGDRIHFRGLIISPDGSESYETTREGARADAIALGTDAARELRAQAGEKFFTLFSGAGA